MYPWQSPLTHWSSVSLCIKMGIINVPIELLWVLSNMSLSKLWEIVKDREPRVLQSMGSQRVEHDWATEQQRTTSDIFGTYKCSVNRGFDSLVDFPTPFSPIPNSSLGSYCLLHPQQFSHGTSTLWTPRDPSPVSSRREHPDRWANVTTAPSLWSGTEQSPGPPAGGSVGKSRPAPELCWPFFSDFHTRQCSFSPRKQY